MAQKLKRSVAAGAAWAAKIVGPSLHDVALMTIPKVTRGDFGTGLKRYLKDREFSAPIDRALMDKLYQKTQFCLRQKQALKEMRTIAQSKDWNRRQAVLGSLLKRIKAFEARLEVYRNVRLPLTDILVRSVMVRLRQVNEPIKYELCLAAKIAANEKKLISGFAKQRLESEYILDVFDHLGRCLPSLTVEEIKMIVAGCVHVGRILPHTKSEQDIQDLIYMRVRRTKESLKSESLKHKWWTADAAF